MVIGLFFLLSIIENELYMEKEIPSSQLWSFYFLFFLYIFHGFINW